MAALAFPGWTVCDYEIRSGGVSYTCKTVEHLRELHPGGALYMLVGTDQLMQLERWRRPESLLRAVVVCVALRRGGEESRAAAKAEALRRAFGADVRFVPYEPVEVSSTEVRPRSRRGGRIRCWTTACALYTGKGALQMTDRNTLARVAAPVGRG